MAGNYPDVPGRRMAYDADGTVCLNNVVNGGDAYPYSEFTAGQTAELNDEDNVLVQYQSGNSAQGHYAFIFPELRDLDGVFGGANSSNHLTLVEDSADTTNGTDGTWATVIADLNPSVHTFPNYRDDIQTVSRSGKRAIRFRVATGANSHIQSIHLYGEIASGSTPDRLLFIDELTGLEYTLPIDWGDVPRGTVHDRELRIKNNSSGLTANTITLSFGDLYRGSSSWYTIKETGGAFAPTLGITSIGAGVTYPAGANVITVRKTTSDIAGLGLHAARLKANTTSWT